MWPALRNRNKLRKILLLLWGQKGIKFHENVLPSCALEIGERIRYKIEMKNVNFYIEILNSWILFKPSYRPMDSYTHCLSKHFF